MIGGSGIQQTGRDYVSFAISLKQRGSISTRLRLMGTDHRIKKERNMKRLNYPADESKLVTIKDINMSFKSMVFFMVKWAIATIPAAIILFLFAMCIVTVLRAFV